MTQFYSRKDAKYNGDVYDIPFSYIDKEEIRVYIDNEQFTDWQFLNDSQIKLISVPEDITSETIISVRRITDISKPMVEFTNNTMLLKESLNLSQNQMIDAIQEVYDNNIQFNIDTLNLIDNNKTEIETEFNNFAEQITEAMDVVIDAATKIERLDEAVEEATLQATLATQKAEESSEASEIATQKAEEVQNALVNYISKSDIATPNKAGIVKPDGLTIEITQDGTISSNNLGNEVGDIIWRLLPSNDAGKHLLDGSLIQGSGIYSAFVDYIAGLYEDNPTANYFAQGYTEELTFNQPVLSANGTLGGDSFAVSASSEYSSTYAIWKACNGVSSDINNGWVSQTHNGQYYIFYNPIPLKVTNISIQNGDTTARAILEWEVLGSNDNSTWETITTGVNSNTAIYAVWNINLSSNTNYYKYYKISAITDSGLAAICELGITATYQGATFTPEQEWQATVAQYGACGKFVYDSTNNTVRLPKVTGIVEGTIDATALGDLIAAGLPNIISTAGVTTDNEALMTGAFSWTRRTNNLVVYNPSGSYPWGTLTLDASQSSPIYGNSSTVQPQTIKGYYYIVVATSTKTDIQVDIDEIATDLNGKADVDLTNCTRPYIIESYSNGTTWYRKYSDGWLEQGWRATSGGAVNATVAIPVPYRDTNYTCVGSISDPTDLTVCGFTAFPATASTVYALATAGQNAYQLPCNFYACGFVN